VKFTTALTLALALLPAVASAKTIKFPEAAPLAQIDIPDSWTITDLENGGFEAISSDESLYISIDVSSSGSIDQAIDEATEYLDKSGAKINPDSIQKTETEMNGMQGMAVKWDGTWDGDAVDMDLTILVPKPGADKLLLITSWGTKEAEEKHMEEILNIATSLAALQ
jgi:hypothetical protein